MVGAPKRQIANEGWGGFLDTAMGANLVATDAGTLGFSFTVPAATLVRTRGVLSLQVSVWGATPNVIRGAFGLLIVSTEALGVGLAALPTPDDDVSNDWFVYQPFCLIGMAAAAATHQAASVQIPIDSRGQRKIKAGDAIAPMVEYIQEDATAGTRILGGYYVRQQFKL